MPNDLYYGDNLAVLRESKPNWRGNLFLALLAFVLIGAAILAFFR